LPYAYQSIYFDEPIVEGRVLDIMLPRTVTRDIAIFIVHGGGWRGGTRTGFHSIMRAFNKKGFIAAATDYRLAGVNILDQLTDVRHGYDIFAGHLKDMKKEPRIFVMGSSAGAHLAALLILTRPGECSEEKHFGKFRLDSWQQPIAGALQSTPVTFKPWKDIFPHIWTAMQDIVGTPYEKDPGRYAAVSPIRYVRKGCPSILFLEAENEHMFPLPLTKKMVAKMKECGVKSSYKVYAAAEHGFFYDVKRRVQKEAFADIISFIRSLE
jgi:acetyl esterase/lipase